MTRHREGLVWPGTVSSNAFNQRLFPVIRRKLSITGARRFLDVNVQIVRRSTLFDAPRDEAEKIDHSRVDADSIKR